MKVRTSKNLKGTIVIPILSTKSIGANVEFTISEDQFWHPDIQHAVSKRFLLVVGDTPKNSPAIKSIVNISTGPVSIPGFGILKPNRCAKISEQDFSSENIKKLLDRGIVKEEKKVSKVSKITKTEIPEYSPTNDWKAVVIEPTEDGEAKTKSVEPRKRNGKTPTKKNRKGAIVENDAIIIDPRAKSDEDDTDILFVDHEQQKEKLAQHPILSKKDKNK